MTSSLRTGSRCIRSLTPGLIILTGETHLVKTYSALGTKVENPNTQSVLKEGITYWKKQNKNRNKKEVRGLVKDEHTATDREPVVR